LFIAAWIDFETMILPDELMLAAAILGLGWVGFGYGATPFDAGLAALLGAGCGLALRFLFTRLKGQEALGLGDVKLMAIAGLWLGVDDLALLFVLAGILGLATGLIWRWR